MCVTGRFSSTWALHAASTVVQRQITPLYPVMNGIRDEVPRILNRVFIPRGVKCYDTPMVIMWTRLGARGEMWLPNHFVPVMWPATVVTGTIDLTSDNSPGKVHSSSCHIIPTEALSQNQQSATTGELTHIVVTTNLTENGQKQSCRLMIFLIWKQHCVH